MNYTHDDVAAIRAGGNSYAAPLAEDWLELEAEIERLRAEVAALNITYGVHELSEAEEEADTEFTELRTENMRLRGELAECVDALRGLFDEQNGPPLIRDQEYWQAAMDKALAVLKKHETAEAARSEKA